MTQADVDEGKREGLTTEERAELVKLRREHAGDGERDPQAGGGVLRQGERAPKMIFTFIAERCSDLPVTASCRAMKVTTSGYYEWADRRVNLSHRGRGDVALTSTILEIHRQSRGTYGSPRVHAELRLGEGIRLGRKRVERLMRRAGIEGVYKRRRKRGCTRRDPKATPSDDLVNRKFNVSGPDRLWVSDITEHPTGTGKVYLGVVVDAWSRRVVGWSIANHLRAELIADALQMAIWRGRQPDGTVVHSDHGTQYTSWAFGRRLRAAGLLGSMGTVGDAYDNAVAESFFSTLLRELLDRHHWRSRSQLASAIFEWIEAFYNPTRRHSSIGQLSPIDYETTNAA